MVCPGKPLLQYGREFSVTSNFTFLATSRFPPGATQHHLDPGAPVDAAAMRTRPAASKGVTTNTASRLGRYTQIVAGTVCVAGAARMC